MFEACGDDDDEVDDDDEEDDCNDDDDVDDGQMWMKHIHKIFLYFVASLFILPEIG